MRARGNHCIEPWIASPRARSVGRRSLHKSLRTEFNLHVTEEKGGVRRNAWRNELDECWTVLDDASLAFVVVNSCRFEDRPLFPTRTHTPIRKCCDSARSLCQRSYHFPGANTTPLPTKPDSWDSQRDSNVSFPTAPRH